MDKELIKKLSKAGVSSDVILALMLDEDEKPQPEQSKPEPEKKPELIPEKDVQLGRATNDAILAAIEKLTGAVQASNIRSMGGSTPKQETAEDVLSQIINPEGGKK